MNDLWKTLTFDQQSIQYNAHISKKKPLNVLVLDLEERFCLLISQYNVRYYTCTCARVLLKVNTELFRFPARVLLHFGFSLTSSPSPVLVRSMPSTIKHLKIKTRHLITKITFVETFGLTLRTSQSRSSFGVFSKECHTFLDPCSAV